MSDTPPSEFSFDVYPGLNADLDAALARNVQKGNASSELIATQGIAEVIRQEIGRRSDAADSLEDQRLISGNQRRWEQQELDMPNSALDKWKKQYEGHLGVEIPGNAPMLQSMMGLERYIKVTEKLFNSRNALYQSGEVTPTGGENIGDTLHLVAVPWQLFIDNLNDIEGLMKRLRGVQGINEDYIGSNINKMIQVKNPFYKHWGTTATTSFSALGYLQAKIRQDGPWGLMLAQTSDEPGAKNLLGQSPDQLTAMFNMSPEIAGEAIGSLGIFEWLALTLQEDPKHLSTQYYSWMLANRTEIAGGARVPRGRWDDAQVGSDLHNADRQGGNARPRLAVI